MWKYAALFTPKPIPTLNELRFLSEKVLRGARTGSAVTVGFSVHRQLVDEMGGTPWWMALMADLDMAKEEFRW